MLLHEPTYESQPVEEVVESDYLPDERILTLQSGKPYAEREDAFTLIFNEYGARVYGSAKAIVGPFEAEDVAQDTFLKLWDKVGGFTPMNEKELSGLLRQMAKNASLNRKRKDKTAPPLEDLTKPAPIGDPVATHEFYEDLATINDELPETHKQALMLRVFGFSPEEIAKKRDVTLPSAKTSLWRGRVHAKNIFRPQEEPESETDTEEAKAA